MSTDQKEAPAVKKRAEAFAEVVQTRICSDVPSRDNPYIEERVLWHGYDALDLAENRSLVDVIYLLLKGELPEPQAAKMLQHLLVLLANPGPRHSATRAVMNASVSRTAPENWLPIGNAVMSGTENGANAVRSSIKFLRKNLRSDPRHVAEELLSSYQKHDQGDSQVAPGFGSRYGAVDTLSATTASRLQQRFPESEALAWGMEFVASLEQQQIGWLKTGVAAAIFVELGFSPNAGAGLFQMAANPGLLAHAIEMSGKPITAMPFVGDDQYFQEDS